LNFANNGRDVLSEAISVGLHTCNGAITHSVELGIAEDNTASLGGLQCVLCPLSRLHAAIRDVVAS
jgi:hypothetical protein